MIPKKTDLLYQSHKRCSHDAVQMRFDHNSRAVHDHDVTIHGSIVVYDFKSCLKFLAKGDASGIFVHLWWCSEVGFIFVNKFYSIPYIDIYKKPRCPTSYITHVKIRSGS